MPKTKLQEKFCKPKPEEIFVVPEANYLAEYFNRYMKARRMNTDTLGQLLGCSGSNVRHALSKPASAWRIDDIVRYCNALGCPVETALKLAVMKTAA